MNQQVVDITNRVRDQYEAYPYPDYSLFIPLRTQEAHASSSLFASRIREQTEGPSALWQQARAKIFIAGCGDIFPYVLSHWEPRSHQIIAWDLSKASIARARLRSLLRFHHFQWQVANLESEEASLPAGIAHMDSYGVLHHLANPRRVLDRLFAQLLPGATARIMVYNSAARTWIHHLQRAFALLELSAFSPADLNRAQLILDSVASLSPALKERLQPMRASVLGHSARFVDTFFHAREARLDFSYWHDAFNASGFRPLGLLDRYAELDDLPNPLLEFPQGPALQPRIDDRRFENNFEVYLAKPGPGLPRKASRNFPSLQRFRSPPSAWFSYSETQSITWLQRRRLWLHALDRLSGRMPQALDGAARNLAPEALQRLARLGVLFPDDFASQELKTLLRSPMHASMEAPLFADPVPLNADARLRALLERSLNEKRLGLQRLGLILQRIEAAQRP